MSKLTDEEWRKKDALRLFEEALGSDQVRCHLEATDLETKLMFAFRCGWNANEQHKRSFQSRINQLLTEKEEIEQSREDEGEVTNDWISNE